jgi:hypothetical protein
MDSLTNKTYSLDRSNLPNSDIKPERCLIAPPMLAPSALMNILDVFKDGVAVQCNVNAW